VNLNDIVTIFHAFPFYSLSWKFHSLMTTGDSVVVATHTFIVKLYPATHTFIVKLYPATHTFIVKLYPATHTFIVKLYPALMLIQ
jgi:hypothetical protein